MEQKKGRQTVIACAQKLDGVPETIRLIPLGNIHSQKGDFEADAESFQEISRFARSRGIDIVIDYEHQTLANTQAPAAGWIKELFLSDDAICGRVEWTPKAAEYLKNKEYRYLSPVIQVRGDSKIVRMPSVALTNTPAIDGMLPIANKFDYEEGEDSMDLLKQLISLLGLPETATEADAADAVKKLAEDARKAKEADKSAGEPVANKTVLSLLSLKAEATTADVTAEIVKLQNLCTESAQRLAAQESAALVEQALKEGKITPPQKDWAAEYALTNKQGFSEFLAKAVPVVPLGQVALALKPEKTETGIDSEISRQLGISAEDEAKYGKGCR